MYAAFPNILPLAIGGAIVFIAAGILIGFALARSRAELRYVEILKQRESQWQANAEKDRRLALSKSRAVIGGFVGEQLAPYFPDFPFDPTEVRFIGKPVDFIAFRGLASGRVDGVVFVEVKSGSSRMNSNELSVREAVQAGRVEFVEYRVPGLSA